MLFTKNFENPRRVFLRIPTKISAKLSINDNLTKEANLVDISTNGLSFFINQSEPLPNIFEISFQLTSVSKAIKLKLEVKNRTVLPDGILFECGFLEVSEQDKRCICNYICKTAEVSSPIGVINTAALLCIIDVSWRIFFYTINAYYNATELGRNFVSALPPRLYPGILIFYAYCAVASFMFSSSNIKKKEKVHFLLSILFLIPIFIFLLTKNIFYWKLGFWSNRYIFLKLFCWFQIALLFYTGFSILWGKSVYKKIDSIKNVINQYRTNLNKE